MRYLLILLLLLTGACATAITTRPAREPGAFFDRAVIETLRPGLSTRAAVRETMGEPYIDIPLGDGRLQWVYAYTAEKQVLVTFDGEVLEEWRWSEKYGYPVQMAPN